MSKKKNLRQLRTEREWTQEYLAEKVGTDQATIARWENKIGLPDTASILRLADAFGLPPGVVLEAALISGPHPSRKRRAKKDAQEERPAPNLLPDLVSL